MGLYPIQRGRKDPDLLTEEEIDVRRALSEYRTYDEELSQEEGEARLCDFTPTSVLYQTYREHIGRYSGGMGDVERLDKRKFGAALCRVFPHLYEDRERFHATRSYHGRKRTGYLGIRGPGSIEVTIDASRMEDGTYSRVDLAKCRVGAELLQYFLHHEEPDPRKALDITLQHFYDNDIEWEDELCEIAERKGNRPPRMPKPDVQRLKRTLMRTAGVTTWEKLTRLRKTPPPRPKEYQRPAVLQRILDKRKQNGKGQNKTSTPAPEVQGGTSSPAPAGADDDV